MTKTITNIVQNDSGGTNPDTHAHEDKVWELQFEDSDEISLTKMKMLELLTKGTVPTKTAHSFKKWDLTTTSNHNIRTWVVVYDDKSHAQLTNHDFYSLLSNGHRTIEEEPKVEEPKEHVLPPPNPALFGERKSLTTEEEQAQLRELRQGIREEYSPVFGKKEDIDIEE
jgi:hypothetical protein